MAFLNRGLLKCLTWNLLGNDVVCYEISLEIETDVKQEDFKKRTVITS